MDQNKVSYSDMIKTLLILITGKYGKRLLLEKCGHAFFFSITLDSCTVSISNGPVLVIGNLCYQWAFRLE